MQCISRAPAGTGCAASTPTIGTWSGRRLRSASRRWASEFLRSILRSWGQVLQYDILTTVAGGQTVARRKSVSGLLYSRTSVPRPMRPLTLSLSPSGGEGIGTAPSPSERERVGVRVAYVFTHNPA